MHTDKKKFNDGGIYDEIFLEKISLDFWWNVGWILMGFEFEIFKFWVENDSKKIQISLEALEIR